MNIKKIVSIFAGILLLIYSSTIYATTTFSAILECDKTSIKPGEEIEVAVKLENFTEGENGINVLLATLEYDKAIFEEVKDKDIIPVQYWESPIYNKDNGKLVLDTYTFVNESHNAIKIKLKVKENITDGQLAEIKLANIEASDGSTDISVASSVLILPVENSDNVVIAESNTTDNKIIYMVGIILAIIIIGAISIVIVKRRNK